jgi:secondary thiamine-phosphate synthase enzyme
MTVFSSQIELETRGDADVIDVTGHVKKLVERSKLRDGIGCIFVPGATGSITTIEYEPGCIADLRRLLDQLAPERRDYEHEKRWGDGNGHSHLRAALLGPSVAFPFARGEPVLGTWQSIVFLDFDNRARSRRLFVQLVGE